MTRAGLLLLCLLVASVAGCRGRKAQPAAAQQQLHVARIDAQDRTPVHDRIIGVDADTLRGWMRERVRAAADVQLEDESVQSGVGRREAPMASAYRLSLELGVGERPADEGGVPGRVVLAALRGSVPGNAEGAELQASTIKPLPRGTRDEPGAVRKIVEGLVDDVLFQGRLAIGPPQALAAALGERKDLARLSAAEELAGVRRAREAVPALIELLQHKDEQISDRAIGALVAIGDRRAVKPLTRLSRFEDTARMAKVLDAIGSLGGQEARDYLEFISTGHEDADIRNLAAEALERMNRAASGPANGTH
jgi:hypothetical protein